MQSDITSQRLRISGPENPDYNHFQATSLAYYCILTFQNAKSIPCITGQWLLMVEMFLERNSSGARDTKGWETLF